jgi:F0F1-type ATP synthase membrane subunit b/b'
MSLILVIIINIILIFIFFVILNSRIKRYSAPKVLDRYTKEVEELIVELNRAVDAAVNLSEERVKELKRCIRKAERLLKDPKLEGQVSSGEEKVSEAVVGENKNLMEKTRHLLSMGYTHDDIAKKLNISRPEVEFLRSIARD